MVGNPEEMSTWVEAQIISMIQFHIASNGQFFFLLVFLNRITSRESKYV